MSDALSSVSHFACILMIGIIKLKFKADYDTLVGDETKAKNFLLECSKEYKPLKCVDVKKGSIIVTMELPQESSDGKKLEQKTMQEVVKQIKAKGFLPSSKTFAIAKENVLGVISAGGTRVVRLSVNRVSCCRPTAVSVKEIGVARGSGLRWKVKIVCGA